MGAKVDENDGRKPYVTSYCNYKKNRNLLKNGIMACCGKCRQEGKKRDAVACSFCVCEGNMRGKVPSRKRPLDSC